MKVSFNTVVSYVKNLLPVRSMAVPSSDNPQMDARVLAYLSGGNVFYTRAMDGRAYLYYFTSFEQDIELAKYIMRSNGLKPREHKTRYFFDRSVVLRVPRSEIKPGMSVRAFVDRIFVCTNAYPDLQQIDARINQIKQKMNQNVK